MFLPIIFILCVIYIFFKKDNVWSRCLGIPFVLGVISIYNPYLMSIIINYLGWSERYYRFYWIFPIGIIIAVVIVDLGYKIERKYFRVFWFILFIALIIKFGNPIIIRTDDWNIYKIDSNVIEISNIIHADASKSSVNVFVDVSLMANLRQYDASLMTVFELPDLLSLENEYEEIVELAMEQKRYLALLANYNIEIDAKLINNMLIQEKVDYFVRNKSWYSDQYLENLNIEKIGETSVYEIYRVTCR